MRIVLYVLGGLVALLAAAVLVGPSLVDWNAYRSELAAQVRQATGRELAIGGDMNLQVLPAPTLTAEGVRLANVEGGSRAHMMALEALRVRVALAPLLQGDLRVESIALVRPDILLEVLADGRRNWAFEALAAPAEEEGRAGPPPAVRVDSFVVRDGTLVVRDHRSGLEERIEAIDAELAAESLRGPFKADGDATVRGVATAFELGLGRLGRDGATAFNASLGLPGVKGQARLSGTLSLGERPLAARGAVEVGGPDLAAVLRRLGLGAPALLARRFRASGEVTAEAGTLRATAVELELGATSATAEADLALEAPPRLHANLALQRLDLDEMLAARDGSAGGAAGDAPGVLAGLAVPEGLRGSLEVTVEALVYRGRVVRQARLGLGLEDGVVAIDQAMALLPGGSDASLSGRVTEVDGRPRFEGRLEAASDNLRSVLAWLGAEPAALPAERLRRMSLAARVSLTPELLELGAIDLDLDVSHVTGGVRVALRERPGLGVGLTVDKLNLDAYLPIPLAGLDAFDANLDLRVGALAYKGTTARRVRLDGTLAQGTLELRQLGIGDLAGASLDVQGEVARLASAPAFDGALSAEVPEPPRLAAALGLAAGPALARLGPVSLAGEVEASAETGLAFDAAVHALDGRLTGRGTARPLAGPPRFDVALTAEHPKLAGLARRLGAALPADLGRLDVSARVEGTPGAFAVRELAGTAGPVEVKAGQAEIDLSGPRPRVDARLRTGPLPLAALAAPAAGAEAQGAGDGGGERWSRAAIELAALRAVDGRLELDAAAVGAGPARLEGARVEAALDGGVVTLERLSGTLAGGKVEAHGTLDARASLAADLMLEAEGVDVGPLLAGAYGVERLSGPIDLEAELTAGGRSEAELVASLAGKAALAGTLRVEVTREERAVGAMLGLLGARAQEVRGLAAATTTVLDAFAGRAADLDGTFRAARGVVTTEDTRLAGHEARLEVTGRADLPGWSLDATGALHRAADAPGEPYLTVRLRGPLDAPNPTLAGKPFQPEAETQAPAETRAPDEEPAGDEPAEAPARPERQPEATQAQEAQPAEQEPQERPQAGTEAEAQEAQPAEQKPQERPQAGTEAEAQQAAPEDETKDLIKGILEKLRD